MLVGTFTHLGQTLDLTVHDISNTFYITAKAETMDAALFYDGGIDIGGDFYQPGWRFNGLNIRCTPTKMSIQEEFEYDGEGKKVKSDLNIDAFRELGSILRSMKNGATPKNQIGENSAYSTMRAYSYDVQGNSIVIAQGEVKELYYVSKDFSVDPEVEGKRATGGARGWGTKLELTTVADDGNVIDFFKGGRNIAVEVDRFKEEPVSLGVMDIGGSEDGYFSVAEVMQRNPDKNYEWMKDRNYTIVEPSEVESVCRRIYKAEGIVAFDTETTGLNVNFRSMEGYGDTLVGMVFTIRENGENVTFYFPVEHQKLQNIAPDELMAHTIEKYFKPILEKKDLAGHNASFDWKVMYTYGININVVIDTLTLTRLTIWNDDTSTPLNLGGLARKLLNRDSLELDDFVEGKWDYNNSFDELPAESVKYYACADTDNTYDIAMYYENNKTLRRYGAEKVFEIEVMFSRAIGYSEYYGMYANPEDVMELTGRLEKRSEELMKDMEKMVGREFNPGSPKQLGAILFTEMGIEPIRYTATGNPSTDKKTLEILGEKENPDGTEQYPLVRKLLEYRDVNNLISNFCKPFDKLSNDGFFHSSVMQFLETGRVSTNTPNYQGFNDEVKKYIVPRDGFYMFDTDFSSVEYRVLVSIAGEQSLVDQFYDPDFDYHSEMASLLHEVPYETVTPSLRESTKGLNFGIPYGMSVPGLAERMFGEVSETTFSQANRLYNKYFDVQPAVRKFFDDTKDLAVTNGFNNTFFGRRRYYDKRKNKINRIRRQAGNHPIQGTAADLYKFGIGRLFVEILRRGYQGRVLIDAFVHDEVVLEIHKSINPAEIMEMVSKAMMPELKDWCPLYIGAGFGGSWFEAKTVEMPVQVQQELIKQGELASWNGNIDELVEWEKEQIDLHAIASVENFIKKTAADGGEEEEVVLPPAEIGYLMDSFKSILGGRTEPNEEELAHLKEALDSGDTYSQLEAFAQYRGIAEELDTSNITTEVPEIDENIGEVKKFTDEELFGDSEPVGNTLYIDNAKLSGASLDWGSKVCYVIGSSQRWVDYIAEEVRKEANEGEYRLMISLEEGIVETDFYVSTTFVSTVMRAHRVQSV